MKFDLRYYESVASTMDIAREAADNSQAEGVVIQAGEQVAGRGRRGNQWLSPKGNLYQSILLKPTTDRRTWGQLSFVIAVALGQAVVEAGCNDYHLKWPNDVLIHDQKLAGILIEAYDGYAIIGTGINIAIAPDGRAKIHDFSSQSVDAFRDLFLNKIEHNYKLWNEKGFDPIRKLWLSKAYKKGQLIQARLPHIIYEGIFEDLDPDGCLILHEKDGLMRKINSGEIIHVSGH